PRLSQPDRSVWGTSQKRNPEIKQGGNWRTRRGSGVLNLRESGSAQGVTMLTKPGSGGLLDWAPGNAVFCGVTMTNLFGRTRFYSFLLAAALLVAGGPALAEKRVALVIGNAAYQNVPRLPNPVNDGNTIATTLKDAGFDVVDNRHDMSAADTRRA